MSALAYLTRTRNAAHGAKRLHWTDWFSHAYLLIGLALMFGPVLWLLLSSFKTEAALTEFPPRQLPYGQKMVTVPGEEAKKPLYRVKLADGSLRELPELRRIGLIATHVDPAQPDAPIRMCIEGREPVREFHFATKNYTDLGDKLQVGQQLWNSLFITVVATILTLLFNSNSRLCLVQIPLCRALGGVRPDHRHADGAASHRAGAQFLDCLAAGPAQQPVGGDLAGGGNAHRRVLAAPVHADHTRRVAGRRAHGPRQRVAHLLAHRAALVGAGAGGAGHLLDHVALE